MRTVRWVVFAAALLLVFSGCRNSKAPDRAGDPTITQKEYVTDAEYKAAIETCDSNVDIVNTNCLFADKWKNLGEYYYQYIIESDLSYSENELKDIVRTIHTEWKQYAQQRIENEKKRLERIYGSGTIVPIELSYFEYVFYREHAIEMYEMCLQLYLECDSP